jgi:hypothetical protein
MVIGMLILPTISLGEVINNPPVIPPPAVIPPVILMYSPGQEPTVVKMPKFAYAGTQPLRTTDQISGAVRYSATGKNLYQRVLDCHEKTWLKKGWHPTKMRMLVIKKIKNRSFSTSGSVSSSWNSTESSNDSFYQLPNSLTKSTTSSLYGSGSIAPSFSQSWQSESYDIWFFHVTE